MGFPLLHVIKQNHVSSLVMKEASAGLNSVETLLGGRRGPSLQHAYPLPIIISHGQYFRISKMPNLSDYSLFCS